MSRLNPHDQQRENTLAQINEMQKAPPGSIAWPEPDRVWHKGPPPHVGWWNASVALDSSRNTGDPTCWRWWGGARWSVAVWPHFSEHAIAGGASQFWPLSLEELFWTDYWPQNARVPRVNPATGRMLLTNEQLAAWIAGSAEQYFLDHCKAVNRKPGDLTIMSLKFTTTKKETI